MTHSRAYLVLVILCVNAILGLSTLAIADPDKPKLKHIKPFITPAKAVVVKNEVVVWYREDLLPPPQQITKRRQALKTASEKLSDFHHMSVIAMHVKRGIIRFQIPQGLTLADAIAALKKDHRVKEAAENYKVFAHIHGGSHPDDQYWVTNGLWGLEKVGVREAWRSIGLQQSWDANSAAWSGLSPILAVLDTGIDYQHADLGQNKWINTVEAPGPNGQDDDANGYDDDIFGVNLLYENYPVPNASCVDRQSGQHVIQTRDPMDHDEHGTSVAGVIAAYGNNNDPTILRTGFVGIAPKVRLMPVKWMCSFPPDSADSIPPIAGYITDAVDAVDYAIANGAVVINASWGIKGLSPTNQHVLDLKMAIDAGRNKTLFVSSAGNDEINLNGPINLWPQKFGLDNELVVAATNQADELWNDLDPPCPPSCIKIGSNYGSAVVELSAPGKNIWSTIPTALSDHIGVFSGTSVAAPHVAGCAAMLITQRHRTNPTSPLLPKEVKSTLVNKGVNAPKLAGKLKPNVNNHTPRLDCGKAMQGVDSTPPNAPTNLGVR